MDLLRLYSYWRSSASYRVRIALGLKELRYQYIAVDLTAQEQRGGDYHERNPQELLPLLVDGERHIRQSLAIIEYLDECFEDRGFVLLPRAPRERQRVRGLSLMLATDVAPLGNLRVLRYLETEFGLDASQREAWIRHWIELGFKATEELIESNPSTGLFCEGDEPTMADCILIPQVYNALRFGLDMRPFPTIQRIYDHALTLPAFDDARPEKQPDAPQTS